MAYELDILLGESEVAELERTMREALAPHGEVVDTEAGFAWMVDGTRVEVRRGTPDAEGRGGGLEIMMPYGAVESEVDKAFEQVIEAATDRDLTLFDPQRGAEVGRGGAGAVLDGWRDGNRYHLELTGMAEDSRGGIGSAVEATTAPPGLSPQVKVLLAVVGVLVVAYLAFKLLVLDPMTRAVMTPTDEKELTGPPPEWIRTHPPKDPPEGE